MLPTASENTVQLRRTLLAPALVILATTVMFGLAKTPFLVPSPASIYLIILAFTPVFSNRIATILCVVMSILGMALVYWRMDWMGQPETINRMVLNTAAVISMATIVSYYQMRQKRLVEAPQKAERELFQAVMASMHDAIVETDWQGIRGVNDSFCRMTGFTREELIGSRPPYAFWPMDQFARIAEALEKSMRGERLDFELELVTKTGGRVPVLLSVSRILGAEKTGNRVLYSFRNISDLKQTQSHLRETQARLEAAFNAVPFAVWMLDKGGRFILQNEMTTKMYGNMVGSYPQDKAPNPEILDRWLESNRQAFAGEVRRVEVEENFGNQQRIVDETVAPVRMGGEVLGIVGVNIDVTERRRVERSLREYQQRLTFLVEQTPLGVFTWDVEGRFVDMNQAAEKMFGYRKEELAGKHFRVIVPGSARPLVDRVWNDILTGRAPVNAENENITADGRTIICEWYNTTIRDTEGRVIGVASMCQDVTQRRRSAEMLAGQRLVLERIAVGAPLSATLLALVRLIEQQGQSLVCSVMLVDDTGKRLDPVAAPSMPPAFLKAAEKFPVGLESGVCGKATFLGKRVEVPDLFEDPNSLSAKKLYERIGLRSCTSEPIIARDGRVLGTFAIFGREVRKLTQDELMLLEAAARLASIAIEREREETALRRSETLLRRFVDSNIIGMIVSTEEAIVDANDVFLSMLGFSREELKAGAITRERINAPEYTHLDRRAFSEMSRIGAASPFEKELVRKDGNRVPVLIGAAEVERQPLKWVSFVLDLTNQKRAAMELLEAKEAAEIANRAKDRFLNLLSHELRSPLTPILTLAAIMENDGHLPAAVRADMAVIRRNAELEARLIDDLLEMVHATHGQVGPNIDGEIVGVRHHAEAMGKFNEAIDRQTVAAEGNGTTGLTLLLVEDHIDTAAVLMRLLTGRGHRVVVADSCAKALEQMAQHPVDLVLSDIGLPDGTGHDLLPKLQAIRMVPALALSGFGSPEDVQRSKAAGFDDHLTKPVNFQALLGKVAHYAQRVRV